MARRLRFVQNWEGLACQSSWSVAKLARLCGVSERTLETHFRQSMRQTPKNWLSEHRQKRAAALLGQGQLVKEVAVQLGYRHPTHFSREFRRFWGFPPTQMWQRKAPEGGLRVSV